MISSLTERLEIALGNLGNSPWLPDLTAELVEVGWRDLYCKAGLLPGGYGTARAVLQDAGGARRIIARLPIYSNSESPTKHLQVETLGADFTRHYEEAGIRFYTAAEIATANIMTQLRGAVDVLRPLPTLFTTVTTLVRSLHVLDPGNDDYDVSFSEPHIPFSVFISVPQTSCISSTLRIAEAIVHEAMHLQLTLIEQILPLIQYTGQQYYSPWRGEFRNAQGVLHGLYVFRVIGEFLRQLQTQNPSECNLARYARNRLSEINNQVNRIRSFQESEDLNDIGAKFARQLIAGFNSY
jgi:HEXXH motif-containing protein